MVAGRGMCNQRDDDDSSGIVIVMMRFLFCTLCFLVFPQLPVPLFALAMPRRLVAVADALLGMVNID
jgi:hypothetical protein